MNAGKVGSGLVRIAEMPVGFPLVSIPELVALAVLPPAAAEHPAAYERYGVIHPNTKESLHAKGLLQIEPTPEKDPPWSMTHFSKRTILGDEIVDAAVKGDALKIEFLTGVA